MRTRNDLEYRLVQAAKDFVEGTKGETVHMIIPDTDPPLFILISTREGILSEARKLAESHA